MKWILEQISVMMIRIVFMICFPSRLSDDIGAELFHQEKLHEKMTRKDRCFDSEMYRQFRNGIFSVNSPPPPI